MAAKRGIPRAGMLRAAAVMVLLAGAAPGMAQEFDEKSALGQSRAAVGTQLSDHSLLTAAGERITLSSYRGKPLLISLIYTSCHHTCPMMTSQLALAVDAARKALGADSFNVLSIGFDTRNDTPDRMARFAAERGIDNSRWTFAAADPATVEALTRELGFTYFSSPRGFDHLAQTSVIDADGVVHQQIYGESIPQPAIVAPLKQLLWDLEADPTTLSGWVKGVKLFCTVYDPKTGLYEFDYSIFIGIFIGVLALGSAAVFVIRAWRQTGRSRAA
ncbi:MAG: SCO family protein [Gammaproteobacteria bacterium]|nr:SCO family protein [Gammaproteobacteria bacterium]